MVAVLIATGPVGYYEVSSLHQTGVQVPVMTALRFVRSIRGNKNERWLLDVSLH